MKFVCDGLTLSEAVMKVSKACAVRTTAPIMECIKITATVDEISLLATDGEISIRKQFKAEVLEEGEICVPGKLFADFSSKLMGEEICLATGERGVEIKYRDSVSYMQALAAEDFPKIDLEIGENSFVMKQENLKGCLMVFENGLEVIALDGYRLALSWAEVVAKSEECSIICPARTLTEISRMLTGEGEIILYTKGGMLLVSSEGLTIVSRLYQGDFIKKESVIPNSFTTTVTLRRAEIVASAERAAIFNRGDKNNLVTLDIGTAGVKITSVSDYGNVSEVVDAEVEGRELVISMNAKFLLDALRALDDEKIVISFNGAISPFILQNKEEKHSLYLILPVRNAA